GLRREALEHDPVCAGLPWRRSDHRQPLHPAGSAVRVCEGGPQRAALKERRRPHAAMPIRLMLLAGAPQRLASILLRRPHALAFAARASLLAWAAPFGFPVSSMAPSSRCAAADSSTSWLSVSFFGDMIGISVRLTTASRAVTTEAPHWRSSRRGGI